MTSPKDSGKEGTFQHLWPFTFNGLSVPLFIHSFIRLFIYSSNENFISTFSLPSTGS